MRRTLSGPLFCLLSGVCLFAWGCGPAPEDLVNNLSSANPVVREDTAKIARNFDSEPLRKALIRALSDESETVRLNAVESLTELGASEAVGSLVPLLDADPSPQVRRAVVEALGRLGDPQAVPALIDYVQTGTETSPPYNAIWALGNLGDGQALELLSRLRESQDPYVVWNANRALGQLRP